MAQTRIDVWIGTASHPRSHGVYHAYLDTESGRLSEPVLVAEADGPGFLAMHPIHPVLYAACRLGGVDVIAAYKIDRSQSPPVLELLNSAEVGDGNPTHLAVDNSGRLLLSVQYGGGSVAAFSLNPDGGLERRTQLVEHQGGSRVVADRQAAPHPHWVGFSPDQRFAFVPDLGLDQVVMYRCDLDHATLESIGVAELPAGSGPRHMKFHPGGAWFFVLNELDLTLSSFHFESDSVTATRKQTIPTVPPDSWKRERAASASEIRVHPNGRFLYAANRGHDTITAMAWDESIGELAIIEREPIRGATPRNFNIDPSGRWLIAAGQDSHTLAVFEIDPTSGQLTYNQSLVSAPAPICVLFEHE